MNNEVTPIQCYQATDGKIFKEQVWAENHNATLDLKCINEGCENKREAYYSSLCRKCWAQKNREASSTAYKNKPFKEWDHVTPVALHGDDTYFWDLDSLEEYCDEEEVNAEDLPLVICEPVHYSPIDFETVAPEVHDDWEPCKKLQELVTNFNKELAKLESGTWRHGKYKTSHDYKFKSE